MHAGRGNRGTLVLVNCWTLWSVRPVSPAIVPVPGERPTLLKSGKCSELVWLSRSLRARIPVGLRLPVAAVALGGGAGDSVVSGDRDSRATSGDKASLQCRSENKPKSLQKV